MRLSLLLASLVAAAALAASPAHACKGSTEIFNVDLTSEDSLLLNDDAEFTDGKMIMRVDGIKFATLPDDITDTDIDICLTYKNLGKAGKDAAAAIMFWDDGNLQYFAMVFNTGNGEISTRAKTWKNITNSKKTNYKKGEENTIRITLKGTEGVAYMNDQPFAKFKRKDTLDSFQVAIALQSGDWEVSKFAATSVDE
jgi:hypothetical protein